MSSVLNNKHLQIRVSPNSDIVKTNIPQINNFNRISCDFASVPKAWFMVDSNVLLPIVEYGAGPTTTQLAFSPGNYSQSSFAAELKIQMDLLTAGAVTYTITYDNKTNKMIIVSSDLVNSFGFIFSSTDPQDQAFASYLGAGSNAFIYSPAILPSVLTSPFPINFQRYEVVRIRSSWVNNNGDDILISLIAGDVGYNETISYNTTAPEYEKSTMQNSRNTSPMFQILDEWGRKIDMNGFSINLSLTLFEEQ